MRLRLATLLAASILGAPVPSALAHSAASAQVYVSLGDGLTLGPDSYAAILARHLPHGSRFKNLAFSYGTLADLLSAELPHARSAHPTLITLWTGGNNDGRVGTKPGSYRNDLRALLSGLKGTGAHLFVGSLPNPRFMPFFFRMGSDALRRIVEQVRAYNAIIATETRRARIPVIDIYDATASIWTRPGQVAADGLHLTPSGQSIVARIFSLAIRRTGALP